MEGLKPGRIVYFVFAEGSAAEANGRRTSGVSIAERIKVLAWPLGAQAHIGNEVRPGDIYPAMVIRVWGGSGCSNLKVMLDGSDTFWATSVNFDSEKSQGTWHWMFEGQQTRYQPDRTEKETQR